VLDVVEREIGVKPLVQLRRDLGVERETPMRRQRAQAPIDGSATIALTVPSRCKILVSISRPDRTPAGSEGHTGP